MLNEAILSIRAAAEAAEAERDRRMASRRALSRAEELSSIVEELLLDGARELPAGLLAEIRRFVATHERGLVRRVGDPISTLDALFDLQERLQARRSDAFDVELIGRRVA